ncbi:MAG: hypothetical protein HFH67_16510 [Lachnospiraceae bacterium]|nr:hypothetical protein [Lachnospiraceae bacterium]
MSITIKKTDFIISPYKFRVEGNEYIFFFQDLGEYFVINETGKNILSFFSKTNLCESFNDFIKQEYGELSDCQKVEIEDYLTQLQSLGVLTKS